MSVHSILAAIHTKNSFARSHAMYQIKNLIIPRKGQSTLLPPHISDVHNNVGCYKINPSNIKFEISHRKINQMLIPQSRQRFTQELPESCTPIPSNWLARTRTTSRSTIDSWRFAERPISMWWVPGEKPFTTDWERIWRQEVSVEIWEIAMWFQSFDSFLDQKRPMRLAAHFHGDINHHNQHHGHHGSSKFPIKIVIWFFFQLISLFLPRNLIDFPFFFWQTKVHRSN